jgi:hypothetical protein
VRKDRVVIEYVGKDIDVTLATKTSYELGLLEKPGNVRYRVTAELATVEKADSHGPAATACYVPVTRAGTDSWHNISRETP